MDSLRPSLPAPPRAPNLTPLIDIVFLLLVFFLLTTQFMQEEGVDVTLPQAAVTAREVQAPVMVTVARDGALFVAGERVGPDALEAALRARCRAETTVVIRGDRDAALQRCVTVMEAARRAGAHRIMIATLEGVE